jgi:flagellar P-ring protein precursor FlgI
MHQAKSRLLNGFVLALALVVGFSPEARAESARIKDLVSLKGVRGNQLIGIGLVIGLAGTGDSAKSLSTNKAYVNLLQNLGMPIATGSVSTQNVAAVVVTSELPPFARIGDKINVRVSAVGDSRSLAGGTLILSPLRAADNQVYAVAQGSVVTGQANGAGTQVLTVAVIADGGVVEREFLPQLARDNEVQLNLKDADFTTNSRVADQINSYFRGFFAKSIDPSTIRVTVPESYEGKLVEFVGELELLRVDVDRKAKVVINERTGTVVMGSDVLIAPVAITHGQLSIKVGSKGTGDKASGEKSVVQLDGRATVGGLLETLNNLGVKPADLVGILQAVQAAGALQAEVVFM